MSLRKSSPTIDCLIVPRDFASSQSRIHAYKPTCKQEEAVCKPALLKTEPFQLVVNLCTFKEATVNHTSRSMHGNQIQEVPKTHGSRSETKFVITLKTIQENRTR